MSLPWPTFWNHVQEDDRAALRAVLTELLSQGSILGDAGSGRELYRLVRERYLHEVGEYPAPLGLKLVFYEEPYPIMQAEPQPDECGLLARFDKQESIFALVLWRMYDEAFMQARTQTVLFDTNAVWMKWQVYFPQVEPPTSPVMRKLLAMLKRKNFVRIADAGDPAHPDELTIEVLPTLARAIDSTASRSGRRTRRGTPRRNRRTTFFPPNGDHVHHAHPAQPHHRSELVRLPRHHRPARADLAVR